MGRKGGGGCLGWAANPVHTTCRMGVWKAIRAVPYFLIYFRLLLIKTLGELSKGGVQWNLVFVRPAQDWELESFTNLYMVL